MKPRRDIPSGLGCFDRNVLCAYGMHEQGCSKLIGMVASRWYWYLRKYCFVPVALIPMPVITAKRWKGRREGEGTKGEGVERENLIFKSS